MDENCKLKYLLVYQERSIGRWSFTGDGRRLNYAVCRIAVNSQDSYAIAEVHTCIGRFEPACTSLCS